MRVNTTGSAPAGWGGQDADAGTTTVSGGESSLAQVASRLGINLQDLQNANPQITNPNALSPGLEIHLPKTMTGDASAKAMPEQLPADAAPAPTSGRMDSSVDGLAMKAMLGRGVASFTSAPDGNAYGTGGITHQAPVVGPPGSEGYSYEARQETLERLKTVYQSPQFQSLTPAEQKTVLQTLSDPQPLTAEKMQNAMDLLSSAKNLSPSDRKLVVEGFKAAHGEPAYSANFKKILDDPKFKSLSGAEQTAVLSQVKNYPDARTAGNIDRMLHKDWFTNQPLDEKQRSLKTIARFSHNPEGDRKIIDNTLDKFLDPKSDFKLAWDHLTTAHGTIYGTGGNKTLTLNQDLIDADNKPIPSNEDTDRLSLNTVAHEVNHLVNNDVPHNTFQYFNAEYRAWVVGFQAQHGRPPTNQEAMDQRIKTLMDLTSAYGPTTAGALADPKEAQQIFDFLKSVTGLDVNAGNYQQVLSSDPEKDWKTLPMWTAPAGVGNNDNH